MSKKFGLCNPRSPQDIKKLDFNRVLDEIANGDPNRFQRGVVRLMNWQLSALEPRRHAVFHRELAKATKAQQSTRRMLGSLIRRGVAIENYLNTRSLYQSCIWDRRGVGDEAKRLRRRRKRAREEHIEARTHLRSSGFVDPAAPVNHIVANWTLSQFHSIVRANRMPIVSDARLFRRLVQGRAPSLFSMIASAASNKQVRLFEKVISKNIKHYIRFSSDSCLARLISGSSLIRRRCLEQCRDQELVAGICRALKKAKFEREFLRHRTADRLIQLIEQDPGNDLLFEDLIVPLAKIGFDRPDVSKLILERSYSTDHDTIAAVLDAMAEMKVCQKQIVSRAIVLWDSFVEPDTDYSKLERFEPICSQHPEFADLLSPLLGGSDH